MLETNWVNFRLLQKQKDPDLNKLMLNGLFLRTEYNTVAIPAEGVRLCITSLKFLLISTFPTCGLNLFDRELEFSIQMLSCL